MLFRSLLADLAVVALTGLLLLLLPGVQLLLPVYERAYGQFPDDAVAILNYANDLLKYEQDADGALRVLEPVTNDSRAFFPMAVAYNMKGDWRKAEELIKKAGMAQGKQKLSVEPGDGGNNQQIEM